MPYLPAAQPSFAKSYKIDRSLLFVSAIVLALSLSLSASAQTLVNSAPRMDLTLNGTWQYVLNQAQKPIPQTGWNPERVPAMPLTDGTTSVWYKKTINIPNGWVQPGRSFFVQLEKAGHYSAIYWNDNFVAEHFGQFSPFEVDVSKYVIPGQDNEIEVYVHKADTTYIRPGVNINQANCPAQNPDCIGNAYRAAIPGGQPLTERNWVGLVGDITFSWRPTENVSDVFVVSSYRNMTLQAQLTVTGGGSATTAQASVIDGSQTVLTLPAAAVVNGQVTLQSAWSNPVLWGPPPYGTPKLYMLQTQLLEAGKVVDTIYTRFGFREVWVDGKDVMLNGQKVWMVGQMPDRLAPIRYVNDRRPQAFIYHIYQQSGFNAAEEHWDDQGEPWLDVADEMGMLVVGTFYCDGRPGPQSQVDDRNAWTNWMVQTGKAWATARRNHPSIIMWRPLDKLPIDFTELVSLNPFEQVDAAVRGIDSTRPIGDGDTANDLDTWLEPVEPPGEPNQCDTGDAMAQKLANETRPLLTREMKGNFNLPCIPSFLQTYYGKDWTGGGTGLLIQIGLYTVHPFISNWFSISGSGNRPSTSIDLPEWITRTWTPTSFSTEFTGLYEQYFQPTLLDTDPTSGDLQWSGLPPSVQAAFLVSSEGNSNPIGVFAAQDTAGTAWFVTPEAGNYQLVYTYNGQDVVQNVTVNAPTPF